MIVRGFRPVVWVFMIGAAVLICYMLNLRVAAERAELAKLDRRIVATQQNIRALQTEVGTRSRIPQLEQWNEDVLALSAPATGQYLQRDVSLARFDTRQPQLSDQTAEVRLASAETGEARPGEAPAAAAALTPQPAVAASVATPPVAAGRPEVRRASLLVAPEAPASAKPQGTAERPRREVDRVVRIASRDEVRPGPREERARPARDERRDPPVRTAALETPRPGPARATTRTADAPARGARGLATQRPGRELRKDSERRRSARD